MSRGFGSTFGAGTTDLIETNFNAPLATNISYSLWFYLNAVGGGTFGHAISINTNSPTRFGLLDSDSLTSLGVYLPWSTTAGQWDFTIPVAQAWTNVVLTYSGSSTANTPIIYVNGIPASVVLATSPSGSYGTGGGNLYLGNWSTGARNWDGMLAHFALWNGAILTAGEALSLANGMNPLLIRPDSLSTYLPLDGINKPESDLIKGNSLSIIGTRLGTSDPSAMTVLQAMPYIFDPTINTSGGTVYNDFLTETSVSSDLENVTANDNAAISESGTSTDLYNGAVTINGNITEQLSPTDNFSGTATDNGILTESDIAMDSYFLPTAYSDFITETVVANDNYLFTSPSAVTVQTGSGDDDSWRRYLNWLAKKKKAEFKKIAAKAGIKEVTAGKIADIAAKEVIKQENNIKPQFYALISKNELEAKRAVQDSLYAIYDEVWKQMAIQKKEIMNLHLDAAHKQLENEEDELFFMVM